MPCVGYLRVSTDRQAGEQQTSLADQERAVNALAASMRLTVERWYRDEGASGGSVEGRPALLSLIADCLASPQPKKKPGYVLVLNDSRWGRFPNPEEAAYWRHHLERIGWLVRFAENDETQNPQLRTVMRAIVATQATQKREDVRANAKRGSRGTAALGFWGTREPYGYRRRVVFPPDRTRVLATHQRKAPDEKVALTPHEAEASVVRQTFARYASGTESIASLTLWLRTLAPDRKWTRAAVKFLLRNPAYVGDVVSGRFSTEHKETRPESEWVTHRDAHPALIDRALYAECQDILARNAKWTTRVRTDWIVSGIVRCPCGKHYVAGGGNYKRAGKPSVLSYRCVTKAGLAADRCAFPGTIKKEWLERSVVQTIADVVSRPTHRRRLLAHLDRMLTALRQAPASAADTLDARIADATAKRDRLVAAVADGTLTGEEARERLTDARRLLGRLDGQRDAILHDVSNARALEAERDRLAASAMDFRRAATGLDGPALRELVRPWIASAEFDPTSRVLTLDIWTIPALGHGALGSMAWPTDLKDSSPWNVTRRKVVVGARS